MTMTPAKLYGTHVAHGAGNSKRGRGGPAPTSCHRNPGWPNDLAQDNSGMQMAHGRGIDEHGAKIYIPQVGDGTGVGSLGSKLQEPGSGARSW